MCVSLCVSVGARVHACVGGWVGESRPRLAEMVKTEKDAEWLNGNV